MDTTVATNTHKVETLLDLQNVIAEVIFGAKDTFTKADMLNMIKEASRGSSYVKEDGTLSLSDIAVELFDVNFDLLYTTGRVKYNPKDDNYVLIGLKRTK